MDFSLCGGGIPMHTCAYQLAIQQQLPEVIHTRNSKQTKQVAFLYIQEYTCKDIYVCNKNNEKEVMNLKNKEYMEAGSWREKEKKENDVVIL